jgi:hypothetical protein
MGDFNKPRLVLLDAKDGPKEPTKPKPVSRGTLRAAAAFTKMVAQGEITDFFTIAVGPDGAIVTGAWRGKHEDTIIAEMVRATHGLVVGEFDSHLAPDE